MPRFPVPGRLDQPDAGIAHAQGHGRERAVQIDAAAGTEHHRRRKALSDRIECREANAEIGSQAAKRHALYAALAQVTGKSGRGPVVVFEKGGITVDLAAEALAYD